MEKKSTSHNVISESVSPAVYAMQVLQNQMTDEMYRPNEEEVINLVREVRSEIEKEVRKDE
ncbi:MAG: hypothetical protein V3G42_11630 [Oscillospiraceae bacterium]